MRESLCEESEEFKRQIQNREKQMKKIFCEQLEALKSQVLKEENENDNATQSMYEDAIKRVMCLREELGNEIKSEVKLLEPNSNFPTYKY